MHKDGLRLNQAYTTQKAQRAKSLTGHKGLFHFDVVWKKLQNYNYLFEVELLQHILQLRKLSCLQEKALWAAYMLCRPGLNEQNNNKQQTEKNMLCQIFTLIASIYFHVLSKKMQSVTNN